MVLLHPTRVKQIVNLALPYQVRTPVPWITFIEAVFGADNYFVHFNRKPGVSDAVLDQNVGQFLHNLFRKNIPMSDPEPGMMMIALAQSETAFGDPVMSDGELSVFVDAVTSSGFTGGINWYRNMDRNWHILENVDPVIAYPTLMIYGMQDMIPTSDTLTDFVPNAEVAQLECGHWIQQEMPAETTRFMLEWLHRQDAAAEASGDTHISLAS